LLEKLMGGVCEIVSNSGDSSKSVGSSSEMCLFSQGLSE
jgi:hypothetical protein